MKHVEFLNIFVYQLLYSVVSSYGGAVNVDISIFLMYFLMVHFFLMVIMYFRSKTIMERTFLKFFARLCVVPTLPDDLKLPFLQCARLKRIESPGGGDSIWNLSLV